MSVDNIKSQFNEVSKEYESQRKKLIPCFDDFYGIAIENLELSNDDPDILDLGAGTGLFSAMVLEKYPNASIELVDLSDQMLEKAKTRFFDNDNISIAVADYTQLAPTKKYDAVISSLSIHHLTDNDKQLLFKNIFNWLKPNGIFINAEQVLGDNIYFEKLYSAQWKSKVEATDLSKDEIISAYERVNLDKRASLYSQLDWLKKAGFMLVDCLYKYYDFAVIYAKKEK